MQSNSKHSDLSGDKTDKTPPLQREDNCGQAGITTLTLDRPAQYNALSESLLAALQTELDDIAKDESVRVVVLEARGKAFCAGHDLKEMRSTYDQPYYDDLFKRCSRFIQTLTSLPQPVIAKVQGMATAAGCQLVATCDLAVASSDARFAVSGVNLGLFCSTPSVALSRNIPRKRAFEMLFTGDFIDGRQALEWGLINDCVAASDLDARVAELCQSICDKPPVAVKTGKQMFYRQLEMPLSDAYRFAGETMACNMMAADTLEGIDAFIEKRKPEWRND